MPKQNKWKTGGNKRIEFRTKQRQTGAGIRIFFGKSQFGVNTVRSLNTLLKQYKKPDTRQIQILREWKKVKKRMDDLIKEGYTFGGRLQEIYIGNLHNSQRELDFLKQMTKKELRVLSASYKGITDTTEKMRLLNKERAAKRMERKRILEEQRVQDQIYMEEMAEIEERESQHRSSLDIKIQNIAMEEEKYIYECEMWGGYVDPDRQDWAMDYAESVIDAINNLDYDSKEALIDFWENNGGIYGIIQQNENRYYGLFYDAMFFNRDLLEMTAVNPENAFNAINQAIVSKSPSDYRYSPSSKSTGYYSEIFPDYEED